MSRYPKKLFYKIGEVCDVCGVEAHVLRYWESEFSVLAPTRNKSGQRIYRLKDLQVIDTIKRLLYEEGYTISGAARQLQEQGVDGEPELPLLKKRNHLTREEILADIKQHCQAILDLLDRRGAASAERRPQAPPAHEPQAPPRPSSVPRGTQLIIPEVLLAEAPAREGLTQDKAAAEDPPDEPADKTHLKLAGS